MLDWKNLPYYQDDPYIWSLLFFHLVDFGRWDCIFNLLTDFEFLESKASYISIYEILQDFQYSLKNWNGDSKGQKILEEMANYITLESNHLVSNPELFFSQLYYRFIINYDEKFSQIYKILKKYAIGKRQWLCPLYSSVEKQYLVRNLDVHCEYLSVLEITPDGTKIIADAANDWIKVWDFHTGKLLNSFKNHKDSVKSAVIFPDGKKVFSSSNSNVKNEEGEIFIWDIDTCRLLDKLGNHKSSVTSLAITKNGKYLVSASLDSTIKVWDIETKECKLTIENKVNWNHKIQITSDEERIISNSAENCIKVWNIHTGELIKNLYGHKHDVMCFEIAKSGKFLVSGSLDEIIIIWDLNSGKILQKLDSPSKGVRSLSISNDEKFIFAGCNDGNIRVWEISSGKVIQYLVGHNFEVTRLVINRDYLISGATESVIKIWKIPQFNNYSMGSSNLEWIEKIRLSPDNKYIVAALYDGSLKTFEYPSRKIIKKFEGHSTRKGVRRKNRDHEITAIDFTPDGKYLITSANYGHTTKIWDYKQGKLLSSIEGGSINFHKQAISPDGKYLLLASKEKIVVWNIQENKIANILEGHSGIVLCATFTPNGKFIISSAQDNTIKIWDFETGRIIHSIETCSIQEADHLFFYPNSSNSIFYSKHDDLIIKWDYLRGEIIKRISIESALRGSISSTSDGKLFKSSYCNKILDTKDFGKKVGFRSIFTYFTADLEIVHTYRFDYPYELVCSFDSKEFNLIFCVFMDNSIHTISKNTLEIHPIINCDVPLHQPIIVNEKPFQFLATEKDSIQIFKWME